MAIPFLTYSAPKYKLLVPFIELGAFDEQVVQACKHIAIFLGLEKFQW